MQFNLGVQGQTNQLTLFISRLATDIDPTAENPVLGSDLRRIDYWLANDGTQNRGLCRNEFRPITSDDALNYVAPPMPEDLTLIVAEEVRRCNSSISTVQPGRTPGTAPRRAPMA